jgi:hypothetical protein
LAGNKKTHNTKKNRLSLLALEPRLVFDGAAALTLPDLLDQSHVSDVSADVLASIGQSTTARTELVVVDGGLENLQSLLDNLDHIAPEKTVLVLDPGASEVDELTTFLHQQSGQGTHFDAIHLVSHGGTGWLQLGQQTVQLDQPNQNGLLWASIKDSLTETGDLLIYGCNVANTAEAQTAITQLASITSADIAVSTDSTGTNGNWILENHIGSLETVELSLGNYQADLVGLSVSSANINEASSYAMIWIVGTAPTGADSNLVTLSLGGTATGGGVDYGTNDATNIQYTINGSSWNDYTGGFSLNALGKAIVRIKVINDSQFENNETIVLTANQGSSTASGTVIIKDDGTGDMYTGVMNAAAPVDATTLSTQSWHDLNFDKSRYIISSFHGAFYKAIDGGYYVTGENASPTGGNLTTPLYLNAANGYNFTGSIIDVAVSGVNAANQYLLLTTDGLWVWGAENQSFPTELTTNGSFQKVSLPPDFDPSHAVSMSMSVGGVAILMDDGTVRTGGVKILQGSTYYYYSLGHTFTDANQLAQVRLNSETGTVLTGITDLEYYQNIGFAYSKSANKFYTWGTAGIDGAPLSLASNGTSLNRASATFAIEMVNPLPAGVEMIQLGVSGGAYFVLGSDGYVYTVGQSAGGVTGQGNQNMIWAWTKVKDSLGTGFLNNVQFISPQNGYGGYGAVSAILRDGTLIAWGADASGMIGTNAGPNVYLPTLAKGSVLGQVVYTVETGGHYSAALLYSCTGEINATGHNAAGAFGDGTTTSRTVYEQNLFLGNLAGACAEPIEAPSTIPRSDDRTLSVNNLNVNEASPYAVFTLDATAGQSVTLALTAGTATGSGTDFGAASTVTTLGSSNLEYSLDGGTTWVRYTAAFTNTLTGTGITSGLLVRTPVKQDAASDNGETFTLTASMPGGLTSTGTATIKDDGTGDIFTNTGAVDTTAVRDGDFELSVNNLIVNEGTPYAIWTVKYVAGQQVNLDLLFNSTAIAEDLNGAVTAPSKPTIQYYNTSSSQWVNYTPGSGTAITIPTGGKLLVRTTVTNDTPYEVSEDLSLFVKKAYAGTVTAISGATPLDINSVVGASALDASASTNLIQNGTFATYTGSGKWGVYSGGTLNFANWTESGGGTGTYARLDFGGVYFGNQSGWTMYDGTNTNWINNISNLFNAQGFITGDYYFRFNNPTPQLGTFGDNDHPLALDQTIQTEIGSVYRLQFSQLSEYADQNKNGIAAVEINGQRVYFMINSLTDKTYTLEFAANSASTNIKFMSWGHVNSNDELVLNNVIVNKIPSATGTLTILDNGTGSYFDGTSAAPLANPPALNDDRGANPLVNDITVNEGSPYGVFSVKGLPGAEVTLSLTEGADANGTAPNADVSGLQWFDSTANSGAGAWVDYNATAIIPSNGELLVRFVPTNDAVYEISESATLTATYTGNGAAVVPNASDSGIATIKDDGTGQWFAGTSGTGSNTAPTGSYLNDERPVTVTGFTVNEGSPYGIFKVNGASGRYVSLNLASGSAVGGTTTPTDGSVDFNTNLQYFNGTTWVNYTPGSYVQIPTGSTALLVRTAIVNDTPYEGAQTLTLTAANTQGTSSAPGTGTIIDDGTGDVYLATNTTGTANASTDTGYPATLDNDKPVSVNDITVNEGSPYAVFTVSDTGGRSITLGLTAGSATGAGTDFGAASTVTTVGSSNLEYSLDGGTTWVRYTAPFNSTLTGNGITSGLLVRTVIKQDTAQDNGETFNLVASVSGNAALGDTGTATIKDDGTGQWFTGAYNATTNPNVGIGSDTAPAGSYLDDDTPVTVNNITVNEGSPYAVFTISAKEGQRVQAALSSVTSTGTTAASSGTDYTNTMEYWNGTAWVSLTANTFITVPGDGDATAGEPTNLLVRVAITNDATADNNETFKLTAKNGSLVANVADSNGATGICTIKDDGTGTYFATSSTVAGVTVGTTSTPPIANTLTPASASYVTAASTSTNPVANDDRALSVNSITVSEGSYAVFTVTGAVDQYVQLSVSNGTSTIAAGGTTSPTDGSVDYLNNSLQYWDGSAWQNYTPGDYVKIPNGGTTLKVRVATVGDSVVDNSEIFKLNASNTQGTPASGTATIKDDGTGNQWDASGNLLTNASATVVDPATSAYSLANDDRTLTVNNVVVNEGSPYAEFTVTGATGQYMKLGLAGNTATAGTDFTTLEYWNGTAWTAYTADTYLKLASTTMKVRVAITNDTVADNGETFKLTAYNTNGAANVANASGDGTATIKDDGTGDKYTYTTATTASANKTTGSTNPSAPTSGFDDDRPLTVTGSTVNEASPYLVFEVGGASGQYVTLTPASGTATLGTDTADAGGTGKPLQYFNGTSWANYTPGSLIQIPTTTSGKLLVRTALTQDATYEMAETIKLTAANAGGGGATGLGTIVDNGTGSYFESTNNTFTSAVPSGTTLDDDRTHNPAFVNNVEVNEGSPYVVFTVSGVPNANVMLAVSDVTAIGGSTANANGTVDYNNTVLEYYDTTTSSWQSYDPLHPPKLSSTVAGDLLVRIPIFQDTVLDGGETLKLTVHYAASGLQTGGVTGLNSAVYDGYAVIKDDGTGAQWTFASASDSGTQTTSPTDGAPGAGFDDDRPVTVNDLTVNEGSRYAVYTVGAKEGQYVKLELAPGATNPADPASNADYTPALEYWNGSAWSAYTTGTYVAVPSDGDTTPGEAANLLVRVAITNDAISDNGETIKLTAYNTTGAANVADATGGTGIVTIKDDGTGTIFTTASGANGGGVAIDVNPTPSSTPTTVTVASGLVVDPADAVIANDDRPVTVDDVSVNEGSPYAVFTVSGNQNQYVTFALADGTAKVVQPKLDANGNRLTGNAALPLTDGTEDYGPALQYSTDGGTTWVSYTAGTLVKIVAADGKMLVRTAIVNDVPSDDGQTFTLSAANTNASADVGTATVHDDGTGTIFNANGTVDNSTPKDDDRVLTVGDVAVNEGSPYAVFTLGNTVGRQLTLSLGDVTADGLGVDYGATGATNLQYSTDGGTTWVNYTGAFDSTLTNGASNVLVRTPVANDGTEDTGETFTLTATLANGSSATGTGTITDEGSGTIFADNGTARTNASANVVTPTQAQTTPLADDDRPLTVNNVDVNEGSYAVFTVGAHENQYVKLSLGNTASTSDVDANLGSDLSNQLQYWDGSSWVNYTEGTYVRVPSNGTGSTDEVANLMVRVLTTQDTPFESAQTFSLTATNSGDASATGVGTIYDDGTGDKWSFASATDLGTRTASGTLGASFDDDRPTISIGSVTVSERGNGYAVVQVSLSQAAGSPMSFVPYLSRGGSNPADLGVDTHSTQAGHTLEYSSDGGLTWADADAGMTFSAGETTLLLRSAVVLDSTTESPETYLVQTVGTTGMVTGTVTITDDPLVSISNVTVNEASPFAIVEVSLSNAASADVTFTPSLANGTGTAGTDATGIEYYNGSNWVSAASGVTIETGQTRVLLRTAMTHDTLNEVSETVNIVTGTFGGAGVANAAGVTGVVTIVDQGSTAAGSTNMFSADASSTTADLMPASGAVIVPSSLSSSQAMVDDDRALTVSDVTVNEASPQIVFTVTGAAGQYVRLNADNISAMGGAAAPTDGTVDYSTQLQYLAANGTWQDYTPGSFVQIPNGGTTLLVRTAVVNDAPYEGAQTFKLTAYNTGGAANVADGQGQTGIGTIVDDGTGHYFAETNNGATPATPSGVVFNDDRSSFSVSDVSVNEADGTMTFVVSRTGDIQQVVSVNYASTDDAATLSDADYTAISGVLNFAAGVSSMTVEVPITDNTIYEGSETLKLILSGASAGSVIADDTGVGTINDAADLPTVSITHVSVIEATEPYAIQTVTLSNASMVPITFTPTLANAGSGSGFATIGTDTVGADTAVEYSFNGSTWLSAASGVTIPAGTTSVQLRSAIHMNDGIGEPTETYNLHTGNLTAGSATITAVTGVVSIVDNPIMTISNVTVNEASPYAVVQVSLSTAASQAITFTPSLANGSTGTGTTADVGTLIEYYDTTTQLWTSAASGVTIATGANGVLLRTAITHDAFNEVSETVNIVTGTANNVLNPSGVTGTITILDQGTNATAGNNAIFTAGNHTATTDNLAPVNSAVVDPDNVPSGQVLLDDDRPLSVDSATVNEASPFIVFKVTGAVNQYVRLSTTDGSATGGTTAPTDGSMDFSQNLQYFDGSAWQNYTSGTFVKMPGGGTTLLVRTAVVKDAPYEGAETFNLVASNTSGGGTPLTQGVGTILDDGSGPVLVADDPSTPADESAPVNGVSPTVTPFSSDVVDPTNVPQGQVLLNDDRPLTVNSVEVNESSPYLIWTVGGKQGQYVSLSTSSGSAATGADTAGGLQWWNGSQWLDYTPGTVVKIPGSNLTADGPLLVRMAVTKDQIYEGPEVLTLSASNTGGSSNVMGSGTIRDDGQGNLFVEGNQSGTPDLPGTPGAPASLDDDRVVPLAPKILGAGRSETQANAWTPPWTDFLTYPGLHVLDSVQASSAWFWNQESQGMSGHVMAGGTGGFVEGLSVLRRTDELIDSFNRETDPDLHVQHAVADTRMQANELRLRAYLMQTGMLREPIGQYEVKKETTATVSRSEPVVAHASVDSWRTPVPESAAEADPYAQRGRLGFSQQLQANARTALWDRTPVRESPAKSSFFSHKQKTA